MHGILVFHVFSQCPSKCAGADESSSTEDNHKIGKGKWPQISLPWNNTAVIIFHMYVKLLILAT